MKLHRCPKGRNHHPDLPLFAWADRQGRVYRLPLPARRIRDRFGLSGTTAALTAELAGFAMGER
jgi:hypothetical protein